jgi:hypothetical protein
MAGKVKVKGAPQAIKNLLSGNPVDSVHGHGGTNETKRKVSQSQKFNVRQKPTPSGQPPAEYGKAWQYAEQPQSGI